MYTVRAEDINALLYGLDHHIPTKEERNTITTEFERFLQSLLKDISHIPENEVGQIKTKLHNTCEKCCNANVPNYQKRVINNLSKHEANIILKQGREIVTVDKTKHSEKCLTLLSTKQFQTLIYS